MNLKKASFTKIFSVITSVLIVIMVIFIIFLTYCNISGRVAYIGDYAFVRVLTSSMEPTIPAKSYILVQKVKTDNLYKLKTGDVIMFYSHDPAIEGSLNTHRIVDITVNSGNTSYYTKGDNNPSIDSLTTKPEDIAGKYVKNLPNLSKFSAFFQNKIAYFFLILIPSAMLLTLCIIEVVKKSKEVRIDALVAKEVAKLKESGLSQGKSDSDSDNNLEE